MANFTPEQANNLLILAVVGASIYATLAWFFPALTMTLMGIGLMVGAQKLLMTSATVIHETLVLILLCTGLLLCGLGGAVQSLRRALKVRMTMPPPVPPRFP